MKSATTETDMQSTEKDSQESSPSTNVSPAKEIHQPTNTQPSTSQYQAIDENLWAKKNSEIEEKSREEEFDEYLQDLLL